MIQFSEAEVLALMKEARVERCVSVIKQIIEYLRTKKETDTNYMEFLTSMLQQGHIKLDMFLKMQEAIENPEMEYIVTTKQDYSPHLKTQGSSNFGK